MASEWYLGGVGVSDDTARSLDVKAHCLYGFAIVSQKHLNWPPTNALCQLIQSGVPLEGEGGGILSYIVDKWEGVRVSLSN